MIQIFHDNKDGYMIRRVVDTVCKSHHGITDDKMDKLKNIWVSFFQDLINGIVENKQDFLRKDPVCYGDLVKEDSKTKIKDISKSEFVKEYKDRALKLLAETKINADNAGVELSKDDLVALQKKLEDLTMYFDEENIFSSVPELMRNIRGVNGCSAKEYLMGKFKYDRLTEGESEFVRINLESSVDSNKENSSKSKLVKKYDLLTGEEKELLSHFGHQTLEALLIHILSCLYSYENSVSVIHLIERIENRVRRYGQIIKERKPHEVGGNESVDFPASIPVDETPVDEFPAPEFRCPKKAGVRYPFGVGLLEFLIERGLISLITNNDGDVHKKEKMTGEGEKKRKAQSYYSMKSLHAKCNFDPIILPIHMNLPMVAPPVDWHISPKAIGNSLLSISDIEGGYYSSANALERYELLSSWDSNNFTILFGINDKIGKERAESLCSIMNNLQKQPFRVNSNFLFNLKNNEIFYVLFGLLLPSFFQHIDLDRKGPKYESMESEAVKLLRRIYNTNIKENMQICSLNEMFRVLEINVAQARFEQTIIKLAEAYEGYNFYLPAFLDFRGRIYRSGILHFHERELARCLLMLGSDKKSHEPDYYFFNATKTLQQDRLKVSTANHYKTFQNESEAIEWFTKMYSKLCFKTNDRWDRVKESSKYTSFEDILLEELLELAKDAKEPLLFLSKMNSVFFLSAL